MPQRLRGQEDTFAQLLTLDAVCEVECLVGYEVKRNTLTQLMTLDALCKVECITGYEVKENTLAQLMPLDALCEVECPKSTRSRRARPRSYDARRAVRGRVHPGL